MTFDEFCDATRRATSKFGGSASVSVFRYLPADLLTPVSAYLRLRTASRFSFLLESVERGEQLARYSFIGTQPSTLIKAYGPHTFVETLRSSVPHAGSRDGDAAGLAAGLLRPAVAEGGNVFDILSRELGGKNLLHNPDLPPLTSGAVGYLGYDVVRLLEHLPSCPEDDRELPDAAWGVFDTVVAFDHARQMIVLTERVGVDAATVHDTDQLRSVFNHAMAVLNGVAQKLTGAEVHLPDPVEADQAELRRTVDREAYQRAIKLAQDHIRAGDIFQVVLSQRIDLPFEGDAFNLYRSLRQTNPSPYLFYLDVDGLSVIGSSPESLVRVQDRRISTVPIAGTRRRGATPAEDAELADELAADPKELAEHVMLVDLGRNDIGRVSTAGSVRVDEFQEVVRYSHVMHLVSLVSGELDPEYSALDALKACFPAGTVTGAPKVRAMEIIDALEPRKRGPYAGAVGYVDYSGNMDVCITIRTIVANAGWLHMQAGAGIVADSDPALEWEETENKVRALLEATRIAATGFTATASHPIEER